MHFKAAVSFGKWPRALTARRILAVTDSMAFVVQTMRRISVSKRRNGVNASQAFSQSQRPLSGRSSTSASEDIYCRESPAGSIAIGNGASKWVVVPASAVVRST